MSKNKERNINLDEVIQQLELELIEFTHHDIQVKKARLPLTSLKDSSALIYNLYIDKKYKETYSTREIDQITQAIIKRAIK
jgi:hypothetical protein